MDIKDLKEVYSRFYHTADIDDKSDTEVIVKKKKKEEIVAITPIIESNYKDFLKELNNPLVDLDYTYLTTNHLERLKFYISGYPFHIILDNIYQYLIVIGIIEWRKSKEQWKDIKSHNLKIYEGSFYCKFLSDYDSFNVSYYYNVSFRATRLPYCCGVSEYGEFIFNALESISKELSILKYNLFIDLIRLHSMYYRKEMSGAYSMINYFVETEFDKVLSLREDITFIKKFTNPKTKTTLNTYIFDSQVE